MSDYNLHQLQMLFHFFLLGFFISLVYDVLRFFRRIICHAGFVIALEDLAFWTITGFLVFALFQKESNGTIRFFSIGGSVLGMICKNQLTGNIKLIKMKLCKHKKGERSHASRDNVS